MLTHVDLSTDAGMDRDVIVTAWREGLPTSEIGARLGLSPTRVRVVIAEERRRRGVESVPHRPQRLLGPARSRLAIELWARRLSVRHIARVVGISPEQVYRVVRTARDRLGSEHVPYRQRRREGYRAMDRAARFLRLTGQLPDGL